MAVTTAAGSMIMMKQSASGSSAHVVLLLAALFGLSACATGETPITTDEGGTICSDPRPQLCTMQYDPVCATLADGSTATYANACGACSDAEVVSHLPGACE